MKFDWLILVILTRKQNAGKNTYEDIKIHI